MQHTALTCSLVPSLFAKTSGLATLLCAFVSTAFSAPIMTVSPGGVQTGNWVWNIGLTPDLSLVPDNSGTPVAVELGFRLSGGSLLSVMNVNPSEFDTSNPGQAIFGWEVTYPDDNNRPEGIEANCIGCTVINPVGGHSTATVPGLTNEIFVAMGSVNFATPGQKPFLQITATGPSSGATSSTLQWLGVYGTGSSNGRITQVTGLNGSTYTTTNFDTFSGSATQSVPEPTSVILIWSAVLGLVVSRWALGRRECLIVPPRVERCIDKDFGPRL